MVMDTGHRRDELIEIGQRHLFGHGSLGLHQVGERLSVEILHHVVSRIVFHEHIVHLHDVGMLELGDGTCLLEEFLFVTFHHVAVALCAQGHLRLVALPIAIIFHKKLFHRHLANSGVGAGHLLGQIGDTESSLS